MVESPNRKVKTGGMPATIFRIMVATMVAKKITAMTLPTRSSFRGVGVMMTSPTSGLESMAARSIVLMKAGIESSNRSEISTLPARNTINVVTSPVIRETPPELTAKTTSTESLRVFRLSKPSESTSAMETRVAVMLSQRLEKTNENIPTRKISLRSLIWLGSRR